ncbi:cysteine proteinase [Sistotremastrum suecicum HHB10207 ss-3]|uniref:Cysteine proteinase n=1 Tax=Sistotremastrum suecicum HHB10207 ss-3 TaxID=1314776 RepID=A0A166INS0_9AGAM|nr:cysteine proteinase [Sistotremastrum suecicum HHB10207 ss-3]
MISLKRSASPDFSSSARPTKAPRVESSPNSPTLTTRWKGLVYDWCTLIVETINQSFYYLPPMTQLLQPSGTATITQMPLESEASLSSDHSTTQSSSSSDASNKNSSQEVDRVSEHPPRWIRPSRPRVLVGQQGIHKARKPREHIHAQLHKEHVREHMRKELYNLERAKGYSSDFSTFKAFLDYKARVEDLSRLPSSPTPSASFYAPLDSQSSRPRNVGAESHTTEGLRRALERARDSLNAPGPAKPFLPTLDQLRISDRQADERIERRLRPKTIIPESLPPAEAAEAERLLSDRKFSAKFAREQVAHKDLTRLQPGQWLNDEIINFYGALIMSRSEALENSKENVDRKGKGKATAIRVHYFNTYFWTKLLTGYTQSKLNKWTKKVDIFAKDVVIIPVNHSNMHWTAAAINFRKKRIESYDSLGGPRPEVFKKLRSYLQDEHRDKKKKDFDFTGWQDYCPEDTPRQENGVDCGVFTMQFLETIARGEEHFPFGQKNMRFMRQRMVLEISRTKLADR